MQTYLTAPIQATELIDMINLQPVVSQSSVSSKGGNECCYFVSLPRPALFVVVFVQELK